MHSPLAGMDRGAAALSPGAPARPDRGPSPRGAGRTEASGPNPCVCRPSAAGAYPH